MPANAPLHGKNALVTGGANGIGAAIVRRLASAGAAVAIVDLDAAGAASLADELPGAVALTADISDAETMRTIADTFANDNGSIDILVNNAGWDSVQPFMNTNPDLWSRLVRINLIGLFTATHVTLPIMINKGGGRIVNIASDAGRVGSSGEAVYSACKGGTIAFTKSIAREMARHQITVNCVCPGPTDTPLLAQIKQDSTAASVMDAIVRATPTRRLAQPHEIAEAVAFFVEGSTHITGQILSVSGGLTMSG
jgi:2-hydroxycyclohexanecarboxyl-CoA dehydrogenase